MAQNPACKTFIPMLSSYADGELPVGERTTVERHLGVCKECSGRVADLRATGGLVRIGMDFAADEVDFKDFAQKVMARSTPHKPPLLDRIKVALSETFQYQRGAMLTYAAVGAALVAVVSAVLLREGIPLGYASEHMVVQSVETQEGAQVAPVVMTTEGGDAIIWVVDQAPIEDPSANEQDDDDEDEEEDRYPGGVSSEPPAGGEL